MNSLVALNNQQHQSLRVNTQLVEAQGGQLHMAPVVLSEFLKLAVQYPIVFTKSRETGQFNCVALFGFRPQENLFVHQGIWNSIYVPLQVSRQPFFLGQNEQQQWIMCIDTSHPSVNAGEGENLFDAQGADSSYLQQVKQRLAELLDGEQKMQAFIQCLLEHNLLEAMHLDITFANNETQRVEGIYTINESRLNSITAEPLVELHRSGYLAHIYTMQTSLGHIYRMIDAKNKLLTQ